MRYLLDILLIVQALAYVGCIVFCVLIARESKRACKAFKDQEAAWKKFGDQFKQT